MQHEDQYPNLKNRLSKSRFIEGLRCPLALYLSVHRYELKDQPTPAQQARFDVGNRVGELACMRYPGGVLIDEGHLEHEAAVASTRRALESGAPAIFEAAFVFDDVKVRVDVLLGLPEGGFELIEVKSTSGYSRDKHLPDAAVQHYVLAGCGIDVRRTTLLHLDRTYVYPGGEYDPLALFEGTDITEEVLAYLPQIPDALAEMKACIACAEPPPVTMGPACRKPYACGFLGWCSEGEPEPDFSGEVETVDEVLARLDDLVVPLHFVDFETIMPALPVFPGTSPFQRSRVQWSIHTLHPDGTLAHQEWLVPDRSTDPDEEFARALLAALGDSGTFVHYSPYERTQLVDIAVRHPGLRQPLADRLPGFAPRLNEKLVETGQPGVQPQGEPYTGLRNFDLGAEVVKDGCLHPSFGPRRYSIKDAIKLLAPHLPPYQGLVVSNGDEAMAATEAMLWAEAGQSESERIRRDLLAYCEQDTLAMVEIYRTLVRLRASSTA